MTHKNMVENGGLPAASFLATSNSGCHVGERFGKKLRCLRKERQLTQEEMSRIFGIDRSFISDVERGVRSMSLHTLEVVAIGMNLSLSELLRNI